MSKFDKYRTPKVSKFDKYRTSSNEQTNLPSREDDDYEMASVVPSMKENDWGPLLSKSALKGAMAGTIDLPANLAELAETGLKFGANKLADVKTNSDLFNIDPTVPEDVPLFSPKTIESLKSFANKPNVFSEENVDRPSKWVKKLFDLKGVDIEPRPGKNLLKQSYSKGAELTGNLIGAGPLIGGKLAANVIKPSAISKTVGAAGLGIGSGTLQVAGLDPLYADLISVGSSYPIKKLGNYGKDIFDAGFRPKVRNEKKVSKLLQDFTGNKDLDNIRNFNAEESAKNLGVVPVTAEVALNRDISNLHNAYAPTLTGIQNKQSYNDSIIRQNLNKIGSELSPYKEEVGTKTQAELVKKYNKQLKNREQATKKLYEELEASENLYPVKNFEDYTQQALKNEVGEIEKVLIKNKNILPSKYKSQISADKKELNELISGLNDEVKSVTKSIANPNEKTLEIVIKDYSVRKNKIDKLREKISQLESGKYRPATIDNTITELGNKISEIKKSEKSGNKRLGYQIGKQKENLEKDLIATPEGLMARKKYAEYSKPVNEYERNKLISKFIKKDEFGEYKYDPEKLMDNVNIAPSVYVRPYVENIKGTPAEQLNKAYYRDYFLQNAPENGLGTFASTRRNFANKRKLFGNLYTPEEYKQFSKVHRYLQNRNEVASGNSKFGSATMPKTQVEKRVKPYLGETTEHPFGFIGRYLKLRPGPNKAYNVLEEALTDPVYARELLSRNNEEANTLKNLLKQKTLPVIAVNANRD